MKGNLIKTGAEIIGFIILIYVAIILIKAFAGAA